MGTDGGAGTGAADDRLTDVAVLAIEGMHCQSCAGLIEETLVEDLGVARAVVDLGAARATVRYDPAVHRLDDLCAAVTAAGYRATPVRS